MPHNYLGLGKTTHNSNITLLKVDEKGSYSWETYVMERLQRKKWSGHWPLAALEKIGSENRFAGICENRDITTPWFQEDILQRKGLFKELIIKKGFGQCLKSENQDLSFIGHHFAHAYALIATLPFKKSYLLVMDGGGTTCGDYQYDSYHDLGEFQADEDAIEHASLFFWDGSSQKLTLLEKLWLKYEEVKGHDQKFSGGLGSMYEKAAQFIFNDGNCSGKVMGLAAYGESSPEKSYLSDLKQWQSSWPWEKSYQGVEKRQWSEEENLPVWKNIAGETQQLFEEGVLSFIEKGINKHKNQYGDYPLGMTGGCALNCTTNTKIVKRELFTEVYVSPFPGDESIGLGCAIAEAFNQRKITLTPIAWEKQHSAFCPNSNQNLKEFLNEREDLVVTELSTFAPIAELLEKGEVIAWVQGGSECGPRSLGHRSLLARVSTKGLKDYLNRHIKFRESFRPYGASVLFEKSHEYFDHKKGFQNPFMSFTIPIKEEKKELLKEVTHRDGTCRMQTVMRGQNPAFYDLLKLCEEKFQEGILLNTSLNVMGEPIVESYEDALRFLKGSEVKYLVCEKTLIQIKGES